jgi:hypothetical protein
MQTRHDFRDIEIRRLRQKAADATTDISRLLRIDGTPDIAAIAGHHCNGLIEADVAAAHQQTKDICIIALEAIAQ